MELEAEDKLVLGKVSGVRGVSGRGLASACPYLEILGNNWKLGGLKICEMLGDQF